MFIYRLLLQKKDVITCDEAIVYSLLVGHSILSVGEVFDADGDFCMDAAEEYLSFCHEDTGREYIDLCEISKKKLSKMTGISRRQIYNIIDNLEKKKFIVDDTIFCPYRLLSEGFIKLPNNTKLKGWQLVFYAFLRSLSSNYNGSIDTWASKMAEYFHSSKTAILSLIRELTRKGYVKRMKNGNLLIY